MRFFRRLGRSISIKIILVFISASALLAWGLWFSLGITFERQLSDSIRPYFSNYLISLQNEVGFPPDINVAKRITEQASVNIVIEAPTFSWASNGDFIDKDYLDVKIQRVGPQGITSEAGFYKDNFILRTFNQGYITSFIITEKLHKTTRVKEILITVIAALFIIGLIYAFVYFTFRPFKTIQQGVKQIGDGDFSHRLPINRRDELGDLSKSINKMADNIEQMLEAKRQLLLAISHELRTPITRAKIALSMMDDSHQKASAEEDMNEMESLIHELLESERLKGNHAPLDLSKANVNDVIYQIQGRFFENAPVVLNLDSQLPEITIDANRIGLAIKNLIKNALTANRQPDDKVIISTACDEQTLTISVEDSGVGIPAEKIKLLTEPFYRIDHSRQRSTGGFGIGLYLIKAIIDAHQGELIIQSRVDQGTVVHIVLPALPIDAT